MKRFFLIWINCLVCAGILNSCQGNHQKAKKIDKYFDLAGLLDEQVEIMATRQASVEKIAVIDKDTVAKSLKTDKGWWESELGLFKNTDINQAMLLDSYLEEKGMSDAGSNLKILSYTAFDPEKVNVQSLKIYYLDELKNIKKITAQYVEGNILYRSERQLFLMFEQVGGRPVLSSYGFGGFQKVVMKDSVKFLVKGKIRS